MRQAGRWLVALLLSAGIQAGVGAEVRVAVTPAGGPSKVEVGENTAPEAGVSGASGVSEGSGVLEGKGSDDDPAALDTAPRSLHALVEMLAQTPVSRLEWAMLRIERYLEQEFEIDPETLAPFDPRFYVNLEFNREAPRLIIEIGRTFPSLGQDRAAPLCRDYVNWVRVQFNVDRVGRPIGKPYSNLAQEFFVSPETEVTPEFADAIDQLVFIEGLVASPISGVYAVCGAGLRDARVRSLN